MLRDTPSTIYLKDYTPPDYMVERIDLTFELDEQSTLVRSQMRLRRNAPPGSEAVPLVLDGEELELVAIAMDGKAVDESRYLLTENSLILNEAPYEFSLEIETRINPAANTTLEGLFVSSGVFCTQCEAEGFRRITYYLDRSDVMTRFSTHIIADKSRYSVLLSNGNLVEQGELDDGRHWARWEDPFRKPSYLFALVAGNLECLEDQYVTGSGRNVELKLYVEPGNLDKCHHAMESLKRAMKWDEDTFGLEYDLDIYMIVAVGDFNMGAMENKGLNVFNTAYVLAKPETATDADYENIEGVIGHEYFHNWTGNRVTCRDWFQLSLKEGLTVFRDQEFSSDMGSRAVKRINDVRMLRARQFPEDAGPMAHPVRPESYVEINNFYTATVYEKGAEVVRMIHTLVGADGFRRGMDLYFKRHDGQAVTTDDFVAAMADANKLDLKQFKRWYRQSGTPVLDVHTAYDSENKTYSLTLTQTCPPTPGQKTKEPFHIPVQVGLLDNHGNDLPLALEDGPALKPGEPLHLTEATQTFRFNGIPEEPVPSVLRGFSAPVNLQLELDDEALAFLFAHDADSFNRWEAGQQLAIRLLQRKVHAIEHGEPEPDASLYIEAVARMLGNASLDKALVAESMVLPGEAYLTELAEVANPDAIHQARQSLRRQLADNLQDVLVNVYGENSVAGAYRYHPVDAGKRMLRNQALSLLLETEDADVIAMALDQYRNTDNMTDRIAAVNGLANIDCPERLTVLDEFHQFAHGDALMLDKWFAVQAASHLPGTLAAVERLMQTAEFDVTNPNKVRAVIGTFCHRNLVRFHAADGSGYRFLADQVIELNRINPQIAARLVGAFNRWRKYDSQRQALAKTELERVLETPKLSKAVYEIVSRNLEN
ncbi:MAG: aminopeptidase [Acidithiobacillales bacterium SG8_45]|jgi:aminopeptidase N|nr:MAG: aminopeptidase [Acidithiobacillales bacterium SG8_45]